MVIFDRLRGFFAVRICAVLTAILAAGLVLSAIPVQAESLTYELSAKVSFLPNAQFPNGQGPGGTITGAFTVSLDLSGSGTGGPSLSSSALFYNPPSGDAAVPLFTAPVQSFCGDAACVLGFYVAPAGVQPGLVTQGNWAYLEFVGSPLPIPSTFTLRGDIGDNETEEFELGGSSGFGEVTGSANLVTPEPPGFLLVGASFFALLVTKLLRQ